MVGSANDDTTCSNETTTINRRNVLRTTTGLAVGTAGLAAASSPGSALLEALVETGRCSGEDAWEDAPADYPVLDLQGSSATEVGDWPTAPDELTIFVHGLGGDESEGWKRQAATFETAAEQNDWEPTQVAVLYQTSVEGSLAWSNSVDLATSAGQQLADWLRAYDAENDVSSYNIVAHSLGGHVTGTLLNELDGDIVIDNVGLLGPAIPNDSVCEDGQYGSGIAASAGAVHNYRSSDDAVVCDLYSSSLLGSGNTGLGCESPRCGWYRSTPGNFTDHNLSRSVDEHCDYPKPDDGCVDQLVADFGVGGGDDGSDDGGDDGGDDSDGGDDGWDGGDDGGDDSDDGDDGWGGDDGDDDSDDSDDGDDGWDGWW